jgi:hypothetical protein
MYVKVSIFGLIAGSLVMLTINAVLHNNVAIAQGYDNYGENSYYSKCPPMTEIRRQNRSI